MAAVLSVGDEHPVFLLATGGVSNAEGKPYVKTQRVHLSNGSTVPRPVTVPQTKLHETYKALFGVIDQHNHIRQGSDSFSDAIHTKSWVKRITCEFFGVVDANVRALVSRPVLHSFFLVESNQDFIWILCSTRWIPRWYVRLTTSITCTSTPCHTAR